MNKLILRCTRHAIGKIFNKEVLEKFDIEVYESISGWNGKWRMFYPQREKEKIIDKNKVLLLKKPLTKKEKQELLSCITQEELDEFIGKIG